MRQATVFVLLACMVMCLACLGAEARTYVLIVAGYDADTIDGRTAFRRGADLVKAAMEENWCIENEVTLIDACDAGSAEAYEDALVALIDNTTGNDVIIFYFVGHGGPGVWAPNWVPKKQHYYSYYDLGFRLDRSKAGEVVCVFDTCSSGSAIWDGEVSPDIRVIASCLPNQSGKFVENRVDPHSFSSHFALAIADGALGPEGAYRQMYYGYCEEQADLGGTATPAMRIPLGAEDLDLTECQDIEGCDRPLPPEPPWLANATDHSLQIRWLPVAGATSYLVFRGATPLQQGYELVANVEHSREHPDAGLEPACSYWYRVAACNGCGCSAMSEPLQARTDSGFVANPGLAVTYTAPLHAHVGDVGDEGTFVEYVVTVTNTGNINLHSVVLLQGGDYPAWQDIGVLGVGAARSFVDSWYVSSGLADELPLLFVACHDAYSAEGAWDFECVEVLVME